MHVEGRRMPGELDTEECYRRAAEARRMAKTTGITEAERVDLLEVERGWLDLAGWASESLARPSPVGDSVAPQSEPASPPRDDRRGASRDVPLLLSRTSCSVPGK
jgi:hypothetical protein